MSLRKVDQPDRPELFISVDLESDGPIPGDYSMLSVGAVNAGDLDQTFYSELVPISDRFDLGALAVSGLDRDRLIMEGEAPLTAMQNFAYWVDDLCRPTGAKPVFVGFNAPYDWMFSHWYFVHFLGRDPFGHTALDIKAYYMGLLNVERWSDTAKSRLVRPYGFELGHNALGDAIEQARAFNRLRGTAAAKLRGAAAKLRGR